jgi:hypothetical protein
MFLRILKPERLLEDPVNHYVSIGHRLSIVTHSTLFHATVDSLDRQLFYSYNRARLSNIDLMLMHLGNMLEEDAKTRRFTEIY